MTAVSEEVVIDSEPTLDDNLDKAIEIIREICEDGFNSVSCANPRTIPPMKFDPDNLIPVTVEATVMAAKDPNYVFIRCETEADPPPLDLVEQCRSFVVQKARR